MTTCNQQDCGEQADFLFTWPGRDQDGICEFHSAKLRTVAHAMGLHLQLIPIPPGASRAESQKQPPQERDSAKEG